MTFFRTPCQHSIPMLSLLSSPSDGRLVDHIIIITIVFHGVLFCVEQSLQCQYSLTVPIFYWFIMHFNKTKIMKIRNEEWGTGRWWWNDLHVQTMWKMIMVSDKSHFKSRERERARKNPCIHFYSKICVGIRVKNVCIANKHRMPSSPTYTVTHSQNWRL